MPDATNNNVSEGTTKDVKNVDVKNVDVKNVDAKDVEIMEGGKIEKFADFLATQPPEIQELYKQDVRGLKGAYKAQMDEREALQDRLKSITKLIGSDPEKAKQEMDKLAEENKANRLQIEFLEDASKPEVECLNPKAAWIIARDQKLFRANGTTDWKALREAAPEIFGKVKVVTNAGDGTNGKPQGKPNMNDSLRASLQRRG
jgi:hypothetical protein